MPVIPRGSNTSPPLQTISNVSNGHDIQTLLFDTLTILLAAATLMVAFLHFRHERRDPGEVRGSHCELTDRGSMPSADDIENGRTTMGCLPGRGTTSDSLDGETIAASDPGRRSTSGQQGRQTLTTDPEPVETDRRVGKEDEDMKERKT